MCAKAIAALSDHARGPAIGCLGKSGAGVWVGQLWGQQSPLTAGDVQLVTAGHLLVTWYLV